MDNSEFEGKVGEIKAELSKKAEKAETLVTDGITKIRSKMTGSSKSYPAPSIPETPSPTINRTLRAKCDKTFDNPVKYGMALAVCYTFMAIVRIYNILHKGDRPSQKIWLASSGIVSLMSIVLAVFVYYIVQICTFILHVLLFYACILIGLAGIGIAAGGAIFFDKDGSKQSPGFESKANKVM